MDVDRCQRSFHLDVTRSSTDLKRTDAVDKTTDDRVRVELIEEGLQTKDVGSVSSSPSDQFKSTRSRETQAHLSLGVVADHGELERDGVRPVARSLELLICAHDSVDNLEGSS